MASNAVGISILATPRARLLALLVDLLIVAALSLIPMVGWLLGLVYFFTKDALSFLDGQSVGKRLQGIRVVHREDLGAIDGDYQASARRSFLVLVPVINLVDGFMVFSSDHRRFGDILAKTLVIRDA